MNLQIRLLGALLAALVLSSCLKTRSELGSGYQSQIYSQRQTENQKAQSNEPSEVVGKIDERDEMIRQLNGRIEALENQLSTIRKDRDSQSSTDTQKIQLLQDALAKMETQLVKLEAEAQMKPSDSKIPGASSNTPINSSASSTAASNSTSHKDTKKNDFDMAQDYFSKKDFKNAILAYQKYADTHPKGKQVAESKYKIGLCFESMGMKDEAYSFYEEVAAQHGSTDFGKKAKSKIQKA